MAKICQSCGAPLVEDAKFCISCGQAVSPAEQFEPVVQQPVAPMPPIPPQYQQAYYPPFPIQAKEPIYQRWWFWLIVGIFATSILGNIIFLYEEFF